MVSKMFSSHKKAVTYCDAMRTSGKRSYVLVLNSTLFEVRYW